MPFPLIYVTLLTSIGVILFLDGLFACFDGTDQAEKIVFRIRKNVYSTTGLILIAMCTLFTIAYIESEQMSNELKKEMKDVRSQILKPQSVTK